MKAPSTLLALVLMTAASPAPPPAPAFPSGDPGAWIGTPQSWNALRGKVVVLDVWTFG